MLAHVRSAGSAGAALAALAFVAGCDGGGAEAGAALAPQVQGLRTDSVEFALEPFQSVEYKYQLAEGAGMSFSWAADGDLYYDMHADPANTGHAAPGEAPSFEVGNAASQDGHFVAPFDGIHGWFWENRGAEAVTVRLSSAGFYSGALIIDRTGELPRETPLALE